MTLKELRQYTTLKADEIFYEVEIQRLKNLKDEKVSYYSSIALENIPSGQISNPTERLAMLNVEYAEKIEQQINEYSARLTECREQLKAIREFIDGVPDSETRSMLRTHIYQRVSFNQIANMHFVSRNYVAKRIKGVCK